MYASWIIEQARDEIANGNLAVEFQEPSQMLCFTHLRRMLLASMEKNDFTSEEVKAMLDTVGEIRGERADHQ